MKTPPSFAGLPSLVARGLLALIATTLPIPAGELPPPDSTRAQIARAAQPLQFEINAGQTDPSVRFLARGGRSTLFLGPESSTLVVRSRDSATAVRMRLPGAKTDPTLEGLDPLPGRVNVFTGSNPAQWRTDIATFGRVAYRDTYPGIDLIYHGQQGKLEYDFVVAPGADPRAIRLRFEGADRIEIDERGDLVLHIGGGSVRHLAPVTYQDSAEGRRQIQSRYILHGAAEVGFEVASYDTARPLTIDPVLWYSTYWGGAGSDEVNRMAVDSNGITYVIGTTSSTNFPRTTGSLDLSFNGNDDVFVTKFGSTTTAAQTPTVLYSTYLGGSGEDTAADIAADSSGRAYLVGRTKSANFPTVAAIQDSLRGDSDAFVARLNLSGTSLDYSTYLGGLDDETGTGIAVRGAQAHVVGSSFSSTTFPTNGAYQRFGHSDGDAFVCKLTSTGSSLLYSTLLGDGEAGDFGTGIALDSAGIIFVTGFTGSSGFPIKSPPGQTLPPFQATKKASTDAFVAKIDPFATGEDSLIYSTYLGGDDLDIGIGIAVDAFQRAYVTGTTNSSDFPLKLNGSRPAEFSSVFVTKLNADGTALFYSMRFGGLNGSHPPSPRDIALDASGNPWIIGSTSSPAFPYSADRLQDRQGGFDAFITQITPKTFTLNGRTFIIDFSPGFSTPFGGTQDDGGNGLAIDSANNVHFVGSTHSGTGTNFLVQNAPQSTLAGDRDGYVVKLGRVDGPPTVTCSVATASLWPPNGRHVNVGLQVTATDNLDPAPRVAVTVFSDETDVDTGGGGVVSPDAVDWAAGTLKLRAERQGSGDGRVYLILVTATDAAGNTSYSCCTVTVPHSQSAAARASVAAQAAGAEAECAGSGTPPAGYILLTPVSTHGARR